MSQGLAQYRIADDDPDDVREPPVGRQPLVSDDPDNIRISQFLPRPPRSQETPLTDPRTQGPSKPLLKQEIVTRYARWMSMKNIAVDLEENDRQMIADRAKREFAIDDASRAEWKEKYKRWMDFALQIVQAKTYPWPNASNVCYPLITTAALQFNARAYPAIVQGRHVVKGTVIGDDRGVPLMMTPQMLPGGLASAGSPGAPPVGGSPGQPPGGPLPPMGAAPGPGGVPSPAGPIAGAAGAQGAPPGMGGPAGGPGAAGPGQPAHQPEGPQQATQPDGTPAWVTPPGAKQALADKIGRHMSWQLLHEMPEWEEQTDRLLMIIAVVGAMFRKNYFDPKTQRNVSETVSALRICVNYKTKSFDTAPRITEEIDVYPWDIETNIRSGIWLDPGEGGYGRNLDAVNEDEQAPVTFCEQHRRYDIDGDGYEEPLIVTFARDSGTLARITVGFDEEGIEATHLGDVLEIKPIKFYTKYGFIPNPDEGVYDIGFGSLLLPLNGSINTTINQMFDSAHLQIAGGGFIGGGLSLNTGSVRFMTGEYKVVPTQGRTLRENIVPMEFPGPSLVLLQLLQFLVESAREVASIKDVLSGDIPGANVPGILGLAVIQQGLKVFNAIFKRVHRSLAQDYDKLFRLNRLYLSDQAGYRVGSEYHQISRGDYERAAGVEPVSDPDMVTDTQQMAQANFLLQFAQDPFFDGREIRLRACQAAMIQQVDKLIAPKAPPDAALTAQLAQLDIENRMVQLRGYELDLRQKYEQREMDIRQGKDKAVEMKELTAAILNLANAQKIDASVDQENMRIGQDWVAHQLALIKHQIDLLNIGTDAHVDLTTAQLAANARANSGAGGGNGAAGNNAGGIKITGLGGQ